MKQCPTCRMTVREENECPFCHTTLTFEPSSPSEKEHIVYNKFYWTYLAKTAWFPVVCTVFCAVRTLIARPEMSQMLLYMLLFAAASLLVSLTQRATVRALRRKYSEDYSVFKVALWKYLFGAMAVLFSFFV